MREKPHPVFGCSQEWQRFPACAGEALDGDYSTEICAGRSASRDRQMHGSGHGEKLSRKQEQLVSALLTEPTLRAACAIVKIADSTAYRWLKVPAVEEAYRRARYETVRQAVAQIQRAATKAVGTLVAVMDEVDAGASARVSAAKVVLELALRGVELEDLVARVAALEAIGGEG